MRRTFGPPPPQSAYAANAGPGGAAGRRPRRLADRQRVHARPGRGRAAGHGVDLRRRLPAARPACPATTARRWPGRTWSWSPSTTGSAWRASPSCPAPRPTGGCSTRSRRCAGSGRTSPRSAATRTSVTVFGESAGAGAIARCSSCRPRPGLFRRAIAQSVPGTFFSPAPGRRRHRGDRGRGRAARDHRSVRRPPTRPGWPPPSDAVRTDGPPRWGAVGSPTPRSRRSSTARCCPAAVAGAAVRRGARRRPAHRAQQGRVPAVHRDVRAGGQRSPTRRRRRCSTLRARPRTAPAGYRKAYPTRTPGGCSSWSSPTGCSGCRPCTWPRRTPTSGGTTFLYELSLPAAGAPFGACHALDIRSSSATTERRRRCCRHRAARGVRRARRPDAPRVARLRRRRRPRLAAVRAGPPTTRVFDHPPDVLPLSGEGVAAPVGPAPLRCHRSGRRPAG